MIFAKITFNMYYFLFTCPIINIETIVEIVSVLIIGQVNEFTPLTVIFGFSATYDVDISVWT